MSPIPPPDQPLLRTPLHALHIECKGRMVPFAGYEMPVKFTGGIIKENLHTRRAAGLFDVSHMGQVAVRPRSGDMNEAARALERIVLADVLGLREGRQRYALLTNESGGVLDDLMIARRRDHFALVVNASRKHADLAHLQAHLSAACEILLNGERALLALQGPEAEAVLSRLAPGAVADMPFMEVRTVTLLGEPCEISRSGYSGEDGFEIGVAAHAAEPLARRLLDDPAVAAAGLGARDSLRLEAGLCLYGNELDENTTPVEAALEWAIPRARREGGARAGGFPGAETILRELAQGASRRRVGLRPEGPAPLRAGALFAGEQDSTPVGTITSGGFSPGLNAPIAMGRIETRLSGEGTRLFADLRGRRVPVRVCPLPFLPHRYKRH